MIQLPASCLSSKTSFSSRASGTGVREGKVVLDMVTFISKGVVRSSFPGSPAGDEVMGPSTIALAIMSVRFLLYSACGCVHFSDFLFCIGKIAKEYAVS